MKNLNSSRQSGFTLVEIAIVLVIIGLLLGGTVGFGTVAFALLIGPMVGVTLPRLRVPEPSSPLASESPDASPHSA